MLIHVLMSSLHFTRILGSISNCCEYIHISIPMISQEQKVNGIKKCIFKKKKQLSQGWIKSQIFWLLISKSSKKKS